jgi:hypothetical protein
MPRYIDGKIKCGNGYKNAWNDTKKRRKMKGKRIDHRSTSGYGVSISGLVRISQSHQVLANLCIIFENVQRW